MQLEEIKELMKEFSFSDATDLHVKDGDFEIRLRKRQAKILMKPPFVASVADDLKHSASIYDMPNSPFSDVGACAPASLAAAAGEKDFAAAEAESDYFKLKSPLVGIYHKAPAPDAQPFVKVGDIVSEGDEVAIVEAMKMMNHIVSPVSGKVVSIKAQDGELVEYDQVIMEIAEF
ncbi:MAG: acetyl-CoA carboxylase biotin carboxyl carrier protein [Clostridiales bacterium]|nr:acetyl-CoA carboxylase biotin carboxyl carrier protein [Clostridiales bacterium]